LLKKYPGSHVTAIDYSEVSVSKASAYNSEAIKQGRCEVKQGDVSALTIPEGKYDLATAFETIYFWPGLRECFAQVAKVLKPGGTFMIVNEADGTDKTTSDKHEGYLMLSGEGAGRVKFFDGIKMVAAEKKALGGLSNMKAFIKACLCLVPDKKEIERFMEA